MASYFQQVLIRQVSVHVHYYVFEHPEFALIGGAFRGVPGGDGVLVHGKREMTDSVVDFPGLDVVFQDLREGVATVALAEGTLQIEVLGDRHGGVGIAESLLVGMGLKFVQPGRKIGKRLFCRS